MQATTISIQSLFCYEEQQQKYLVPNYQRNYAWEKEQCRQLWDDLYEFYEDSKSTAYYLGSVVVFPNQDSVLEVIDGQQRLTTLQLLLRALYEDLSTKNTGADIELHRAVVVACDSLERCMWGKDFDDNMDCKQQSLSSEVWSESDQKVWNLLMDRNTLPEDLKEQLDGCGHSHLAENYQFFATQIEAFKQDNSNSLLKFTSRILSRAKVLLVKAGNMGESLRIFNTLNDRGLPLADSDIFKSYFYKVFSDQKDEDEINDFVEKWNELDEKAKAAFNYRRNEEQRLSELFLQYMHYLRTKETGKVETTTIAVRTFFMGEFKKLDESKADEHLKNLNALVNFWYWVSEENQEEDKLKGLHEHINCTKEEANELLRAIWVASKLPQTMWMQVVSVYYLSYCQEGIQVADLVSCIEKLTLFTLAFLMGSSGGSRLKTPLYNAMRILKFKEGNGANFKFVGKEGSYNYDENILSEEFKKYFDDNSVRGSVGMFRALLSWWTFSREGQVFPVKNLAKLEIEHLFAKKRQSSKY